MATRRSEAMIFMGRGVGVVKKNYGECWDLAISKNRGGAVVIGALLRRLLGDRAPPFLSACA